MSRFLLVVALGLLLTVAAFGQQNMWSAGFAAEGGLPVGDFNNVSNFGVGGTAWASYEVDPNMSVTLRSGYLSFSGKDYTVPNPFIAGQTITVTGGTSSVIPILVGGRYYFMPPADTRVYGAAEVGMFAIGNGGGTKFGFAPTLGAQFKVGDKMNLDTRANFTYIATDVKSTTWIGIGVGLEFALN